jgi:hypothetical protein
MSQQARLGKKDNADLDIANSRTDIKRKDLKADLITLKYSSINQPDSLVKRPSMKDFDPVMSSLQNRS